MTISQPLADQAVEQAYAGQAMLILPRCWIPDWKIARQALVQKIGENAINLRRVERVAFDDANAGIVES